MKNEMPVRKVKGGYRWGKTGKVYRKKEDAEKQGKAIRISEHKRKRDKEYEKRRMRSKDN